jgi:hypothetical protein
MNAHTPGPWQTTDEKDRRGWLYIEGNYEVLARITGSPDDVEAQANARLIAAAPELLEALRIAEGALKNPSPTLRARPGEMTIKERRHVARQAVRAAIAKAEGRAS